MITASKNFTLSFADIVEDKRIESTAFLQYETLRISLKNVFIESYGGVLGFTMQNSGSIDVSGNESDIVKIVSRNLRSDGDVIIADATYSSSNTVQETDDYYVKTTIWNNIDSEPFTITTVNEEHILSIEFITVSTDDTQKVVYKLSPDMLQDRQDLKLWTTKKVFIPFSSSQGMSGTYNEKLTEKENGSYNLTFNIELFNDGHRNPLVGSLVEDRMIRLNQDDSIIDFFITSKTPTFNPENISYAFTAQDAFSWQLSKQNVSISLSTEDSSQWDTVGPKTIYALANKILKISNLDTLWQIDPKLAIDTYDFSNNLYAHAGALKCSFEISNTTPYNAFAELIKLFNAVTIVDYSTMPYTINFKNKENIKSKGLKLNSFSNLSQFSYSDKADNLYSVMHVTGGETADGSYVTIIPEMPTIVSELLIMLNKDVVQTSSPIDEDKPINAQDYPYYYIHKKESDQYDLYWKASPSGLFNTYNKISCYRSGGKFYVTDTELLFWEDESTINGILNNLIKKIKRINTLIGPFYSDYINNITGYFNGLASIPHASSSFYDFSYYTNHGLLSQSRKNKLDNSLNIDLRNINLLLNSYSPIYYKIRHMLNKLIDQEEEYMALMSAESRTIANYNITTEDKGYLSLKGIYAPHSIINDESHYIPIGYITDDLIYYGMIDNNSYINYYLPDFSVLINILSNSSQNLLATETFTPLVVSEDDAYNRMQETIKISNSGDFTNVPVYLKYKDIKNNIDITDELAENETEDLVQIEKVCQKTIESYMHNVSLLWDDTYRHYYATLYGNKWLEDKYSQILSKYDSYYLKRLEIEGQLINSFGPEWMLININNLSTLRMIEYSDLKTQLDDLGYYVGGVGTRPNSTYLGLYDYYLYCLKSYWDDLFEDDLKFKPIQQSLDELNQKKEVWLKDFYYLYSDVIREVKYEDTTQLTSEGLYASAWKQFLQYKNPAKSYSASYITTDDLVDVGEEIAIGDQVILIQDFLDEELVKNAVQITVNEPVNNCYNAILTYSENGSDDTTSVICATYQTKKSRQLILIDELNKLFDINQHTVKSIQIGNNQYNYSGKKKIECIEKLFKSKEVRLRITGLTKDLRSNVTQLTVEENTMYNTLVDRLITLLR